ncbi:MAG: LysR family transcriptional regulator [Sphingomonadales bacterium]|nr:LysR family transcriptional regulator [Sphingomonadales bacterium]
MHWDDVRYFLAIAESGSMSKAAKGLRVNQTTVFRRLNAYEEALGVRLFDRLRSGYVLTEEGAQIFEAARDVADKMAALERVTAAADERLSGVVRVSVHEGFVTRLLVPHLHEFTEANPEIQVELLVSRELANLSRREADVAIRVTNAPAETLSGRRLLNVVVAKYASRDYLETHTLEGKDATARWIGWIDDIENPSYIARSRYRHLPVHHRINNYESWLAMAKAGFGIVELPCFMADQEPELVRLPPEPEAASRDLWVLSHQDVAATPRFRAFRDFAAKVILRHRDLLEGRQGAA